MTPSSRRNPPKNVQKKDEADGGVGLKIVIPTPQKKVQNLVRTVIGRKLSSSTSLSLALTATEAVVESSGDVTVVTVDDKTGKEVHYSNAPSLYTYTTEKRTALHS